MKTHIQSTYRARSCCAFLTILLVAVVISLAVWGGGTSLLKSDNGWSLHSGLAQGRLATGTGTMEIRGLGELSFDPADITTLRPDIFLPGHFSVFDVLVHLAATNGFDLDYAFDEALQTHVIHSLNGLSGWWYDAHYEGGGFDKTVVRMDQFPVKDGMSILLYLEDPARLDAIEEHYKEQVIRLAESEGVIRIPRVTLTSPTATVEFHDVAVTAHHSRSDVFQPGVITTLDILQSLGEQGLLSELGIDWRAEEEDIAVVDGYYVVAIQADGFSPESTGSCVLTHQISGDTIAEYLSPHTHTMSHIHLTADLEVLVSPEAVEWLWICL